MTDAYPGLPAPPPEGSSPLPAGTFDGQTVLVTGSGTGLGKAIATEFARLGANLVVASRGEEHRAAGVAACEAAGGRAVGRGGADGRIERRIDIAPAAHRPLLRPLNAGGGIDRTKRAGGRSGPPLAGDQDRFGITERRGR